jgi:hypothetical protein
MAAVANLAAMTMMELRVVSGTYELPDLLTQFQ